MAMIPGLSAVSRQEAKQRICTGNQPMMSIKPLEPDLASRERFLKWIAQPMTAKERQKFKAFFK